MTNQRTPQETYRLQCPHVTDEQLARWDAAIEAYGRVFEQNFKRWGLTPDSTGTDVYFSPSSQPGHPKSSLFYRLLDGKEALPLPPPVNHSYPWYEVIEEEGPIEVLLGGAQSLGSLSAAARGVADPDSKRCIVINQGSWIVLDGDLEIKKMVVSYAEWEPAGWRWELTQETCLSSALPDGYAWMTLDEKRSGGVAVTTVAQALLDADRRAERYQAERVEAHVPLSDNELRALKKQYFDAMFVDHPGSRTWIAGTDGFIYARRWLLRRTATGAAQ